MAEIVCRRPVEIHRLIQQIQSQNIIEAADDEQNIAGITTNQMIQMLYGLYNMGL